MNALPSDVRRVICYIRKSREDEEAEKRGEDTLSKQRELMQKDVLTRLDAEYDLVEEVASGDSIRHRPVFQSILPQLGTVYQAIVCKDLSRLGRGSYGDMGLVYDLIRDKRIYIVTKDAMYDPHNFSDLRMIRFSLFFNREEYEMTLWRLTEGKYDGAANGKWVAGSVPFGYLYNPKTQVLEPSPGDAAIVRAIYEWYTRDGLGLRQIALRLKTLGHPSPRGHDVWQPEVIRRILKNPVHCGTLVFRKTQRNKLDGRVVQRPVHQHIVVEDAFDAIVDQETWALAQSRMDKSNKAPHTKRDETTSELAGFTFCADCGKRLVPQRSVRIYTKRTGLSSRYERAFLYCATCGYAVKHGDCEGRLLQVLDSLPALDAGTLLECIRGCNLANPKEQDPWLSLRDPVQAQRDALQVRLARARDYLLDGTLSKEDYLAAKTQYESQLSLLQNRIAAIQSSVCNEASAYVAETRIEDSVRHLHSIHDVYGRLQTPAQRNQLLRGIFSEVRVKLRERRAGKRSAIFDIHVEISPALMPHSPFNCDGG